MRRTKMDTDVAEALVQAGAPVLVSWAENSADTILPKSATPLPERGMLCTGWHSLA